jgi:predicted Zn-ribbon and HTH transcriptional regulator
MTKKQPIKNLIKELEDISDSQKRDEILEKRGRGCIGKSFLKKATDASKSAKSEKEILANLEKNIKMLKREGDNLFMIYPKCYCHHVKKFDGDIPEYYCNCSKGWIKELFKTALGREIDVEILSTVLRGGKECKFKILL